MGMLEGVLGGDTLEDVLGGAWERVLKRYWREC